MKISWRRKREVHIIADVCDFLVCVFGCAAFGQKKMDRFERICSYDYVTEADVPCRHVWQRVWNDEVIFSNTRVEKPWQSAIILPQDRRQTFAARAMSKRGNKRGFSRAPCPAKCHGRAVTRLKKSFHAFFHVLIQKKE